MKRKGSKKLGKSKYQLNNQGAAIVLVIVATALITILMSVLMSISLLNFQMKKTEREAKSNFYSAEIALDQIHAGLRKSVSDASKDLYVNSLVTITDITSMTSFKTDFKNEMNKYIGFPASSDPTPYYNVGNPAVIDGSGHPTGLLQYLDTTLLEACKNGKLVIRAERENISSRDYKGELEINDNAIIIKNLFIEYTDNLGYYSEIRTDICIAYPNLIHANGASGNEGPYVNLDQLVTFENWSKR